ncbi:Fis family transcriptional regulator [Planctomycetaceae bacterium SCGC AG-212-F19]|nr:Fis family transcriptional regulator [Planctomycetaceae bacterium SCGC AG-212-F19]
MPILLAIDDDPVILTAYRKIFPATGDRTLLTAPSARKGLEIIAAKKPDVVLLDIKLPDLDGLQACKEIQKIDARIPIIFVTGEGTTETAIEAMKLGAYEYLLKDRLTERDQVELLRGLVDRAFDISRLMHVPAVVAEEEPVPDTADALVGRCPAMQAVYKAIGRVAPQNVTVLILGESGTGKELVARAIYQHSRRANGPFLAINCAAIPETLLESELFGHEKGAFTGADRKRIGKFEQCTGGTLFLDEIGDMTPLTQTKILRVLQDQCFERVGGNETIRTNVRLIAATNRDLEKMVAEGTFRSDLYYRLSVFTIKLPALRERGDDLPQLVDHFIKRFKGELDKDVHQIAEPALAVLRQHNWPGNLRELQSVIKQAMLQATGPMLVPEFLPGYLSAQPRAAATPAGDAAAPDLHRFVLDRLQAGAENQNLYAEALTLLERYLLTEVLRHTAGNQVQAARILGITRNSLRHKIRTLDITIERSVW